MEEMKKESKRIFESWIKDAVEFTGETFELTNDQQYDELVRHIHDHKYLTNQNIPRELSMREAVYSWYEHVYEPVMRAVDQAGLDKQFPTRTRTELFLWATKHWHYLKQESPEPVSPAKAALDLGARFAPGAMTRMIYRIRQQVA